MLLPLENTREGINIPIQALTDSLCDGLAKRLIKDLKKATDDSYVSTPCDLRVTSVTYLSSDVSDALSKWRGLKVSKKEQLNRIIRMFLSAVQPDRLSEEDLAKARRTEKEYCIKKLPEMLCGLCVIDNHVANCSLVLDKRAPSKSYVKILPVVFSMHAVARLTLRLKPTCIDKMIELCCTACSMLMDNTNVVEMLEQDNDGCVWLPLEEIGVFLFSRPDPSGFRHLITIVDCEKMTKSQSNLAASISEHLNEFPTEQRILRNIKMVYRLTDAKKSSQQTTQLRAVN